MWLIFSFLLLVYVFSCVLFSWHLFVIFFLLWLSHSHFTFLFTFLFLLLFFFLLLYYFFTCIYVFCLFTVCWSFTLYGKWQVTRPLEHYPFDAVTLTKVQNRRSAWKTTFLRITIKIIKKNIKLKNFIFLSLAGNLDCCNSLLYYYSLLYSAPKTMLLLSYIAIKTLFVQCNFILNTVHIKSYTQFKILPITYEHLTTSFPPTYLTLLLFFSQSAFFAQPLLPFFLLLAPTLPVWSTEPSHLLLLNFWRTFLLAFIHFPVSLLWSHMRPIYLIHIRRVSRLLLWLLRKP